jgi:hypothetical protein
MHFMLTPRFRYVISRTRFLKRRKAFGAILRRGSHEPSSRVKVNPRNVRSSGRATALFWALTLSLSRFSMKLVTLSGPAPIQWTVFS